MGWVSKQRPYNAYSFWAHELSFPVATARGHAVSRQEIVA